MKINAISTDYSALKASNARRVKANYPEPQDLNVPQGMSVISFKGGNKNHVLHVVAECKPFNQAGGVATVVQDYQRLNNASSSDKGKAVFVTPFYNGLVKYECADDAADFQKISVDIPRVPEGLPEGHPLKNKVGQPVYIKADLSKTTVKEALEARKDYWLLEEVADKKMNWGMQKDAPVKLLKVVADANDKPFTDDVFMIFTEATAYDPKPYSANQYSSQVKDIVRSWNGDPYAKFDKAVVECMEDISKKMGDFDPGTVICSDSQAAYTTHYMAQKNAEGLEYFKGKKPMQIGHNLGDGYIGITSPRSMVVNLNIFTPEELEALTKSESLRKAIVTGGKEEDIFFKKILESLDAKNKCSAISIPIHYGKKGYLQTFGVVSQGYLDELVKNKEIAPYIYDDMKILAEKGIAIGLTNPHNSNNTAFTKVGLGGYNSAQKIKLANGTEEVIEPLKMLTEKDRENLTLEQLRKIKNENKINFLTRFASKYDNAQYFNSKTNAWSKPGEGTSMIRKGMAGQMPVVQNIDIDKYVAKLKKGEDVKVVVSWGRGDFQKAFDEVLNGFKNYVQKTGDKDTLLVMGGDLNNDKVEGQKVKDIAELLTKDPLFKGRVMLLDDFAPGEPMAWIGDTAIFPSRTAPCELTDLEAKKMLCTPIVANGQGLRQKNFDPAIADEAALADAFKTKHQYFDSREDMLKSANEDAKNSFNKVYNKVKNEISTKYRTVIGGEIPAEKMELFLNVNEDYKNALRKLRDSVMADDIAECLERCLITHRNDDVAKTILKNQANIKTGWENNQIITRSKVPTGELYRQQFKKDAHDISNKNDVIGSNISKPHSKSKTNSSIKAWFKAHKKASIIAGSAVAVAGLGYAGYKTGWLTPKFDKKEKNGHLSCVG